VRLSPGPATLLLLLAPPAAAVQDAPPAIPLTAPAPRRGVTDRTELEGFLDGVIGTFLLDKHIAGATVSVVKDGALFFAKGYGYSDVEKRQPVDPERTLFRIGSVSKLFTWTAVMQLVEQGKLDLHTDINQYLDFQIPDTYPEPITLTHVLTHTPGFEEDGRELITTDSAKAMGPWLESHMPERVRPPGVYSSYSNWATAAAGYIVGRQAGTSWDEYIEANILAPLGMTHTTGRQPLPEHLSADMSQGYRWKGGRYQPEKWEIITGAAPAGSISASATDMAKFMLAHLGRGQYDGKRILSDSTAGLMHSRLFTHDDRLPGFAHGFYEKSSHGLRIIGHGGDTQWFHSDLALIPEENLGVFVSFNTSTGGEVSFGPFLQTFLDHYYPTTPPPALTEKVDAARYAGEYTFNRMSYTTWMKALGLASPITVAAAEDGGLLMDTPFGPSHLVPVDSLLFRDEVNGSLVAFRTDQSGRVTHGFIDMMPMMTLERQPWYAAPKFHLMILALGLIVFAGIVIAALVRWFNRKTWQVTSPPRPVVAGRRLMVAASLLMLIFVVGLAVQISNEDQLLSGPYTTLYVILGLPVLAAILILAAAWYAVVQWREGSATRATRLRHTAAVIVALLFLWSLNTWNLLGWRT
jgi:CubicO group peptidase (beta-lactamase class C family)